MTELQPEAFGRVGKEYLQDTSMLSTFYGLLQVALLLFSFFFGDSLTLSPGWNVVVGSQLTATSAS